LNVRKQASGSCIRSPGFSPRAWQFLNLLVCGYLLALPSLAFAQLDTTAQVGTRYQHESNVFAFPAGMPLPAGTSFGDSSFVYFGGFDSTYRWSQQAAGLDATISKTEYDTDTQFDRLEYAFRGHLDWTLDPRFTGTAGASRERAITPLLQELPTTQLLLETITEEHATANYQFRPDWLLQTSATHDANDEPRPGNPNFSIKESTGQIALQFGSPKEVQIGLSELYLGGSFTGGNAGDPTSYHQVTSQRRPVGIRRCSWLYAP
jgi:hypothetical protein